MSRYVSIGRMLIRALHFGVDECAVAVEPPRTPPATGWVWIDVTAGPDDLDELAVLAEELGLDALAVRDTVQDVDLPKVDDFGISVHVVLHALGKERIETFELGCFLSAGCLVTIRDQRSPSIDALWEGVRCRPELAGGGADEALARLADVATRRLVSVLDVFDDRNEELIELALRAAPGFLAMDAPPVGANRGGSLGTRPRRGHLRSRPTRRSGLRDLHHAPAVCRRDRRTPPQTQRAAQELTAGRSTHPRLHCAHETYACFVRLSRNMCGSRSARLDRDSRLGALMTGYDESGR